MGVLKCHVANMYAIPTRSKIPYDHSNNGDVPSRFFYRKNLDYRVLLKRLAMHNPLPNNATGYPDLSYGFVFGTPEILGEPNNPGTNDAGFFATLKTQVGNHE